MSGAVRETVGYRGFRGLISVSAIDSFEIKQAGNIEQLQQRVVSEHTLWIFARGVQKLVIRHEILRMRNYRIPIGDHLLVCGQY
jgi:hypothetical protein